MTNPLYHIEHTYQSAVPSAWIKHLNAWRQIHKRLQFLGFNQQHFGSISMRQPGEPNHFIMSGKHTGKEEFLAGDHYALVNHCEVENARIQSQGKTEPAASAIVHGLLYQQSSDIQSVIEVKSIDIWSNNAYLQLPMTSDSVAEFSEAHLANVKTLFKETSVEIKRIFLEGNCEGKIYAFARSPFEASMVLMDYLVRVLELRDDG